MQWFFSYDDNYEGLIAIYASAGENVEANNVTVNAGKYKGASLEASAAFLISGKARNNNFIINNVQNTNWNKCTY